MQQYFRFILVQEAVGGGLVILANKYVLLSGETPPTELTFMFTHIDIGGNSVLSSLVSLVTRNM